MGYVKLADLVALDEIRELLEVDAKPLDKKSQEEDSADRFWEALFSLGDQQEDFNGDESLEHD